MTLTGLNGKMSIPIWYLKRKKLTIISHERYGRETFAPSHIPLGHDPGMSSSWDLEQTGSLRPDASPENLCSTCLWSLLLSQCSLTPWTLKPNFSHSNTQTSNCTLHRRALEMKQSSQSLEWNLQHVEEYLDIWFLFDCFTRTRLRRSPNWATPTQIPWPTLQATFNCRQPWFFLLAVSWAEAGRFTSWEGSRPQKVT